MIDNGIIVKFCEEIIIFMFNGKEEKGILWEIIFGVIVRGIFKFFFECIVIFMVDGELWDLICLLEKSCKLELIDFENIEGMIFIVVLWLIIVEEE